MKKKILFIIPRLGIGGAEKSLIELLNKFDYNNYDVDLLMFLKEGPLLEEVNKNVKILELPRDEQLLIMNVKKSFRILMKSFRFNILAKKLFLSLIYRLIRKKINDSALFWKFNKKSFSVFPKKYDVAISYLQGISSYYGIDKVKAKKKILWMHTDYNEFSKNSKLDKIYCKKFDTVITVSEKAKETFVAHNPDMEGKVHVIYNLINRDKVIELSKLPNEIDQTKFNIVSVGRLHYSKGFDLVIPAIKKIVDEGYDVKWYVIGKGPEKKNLEKLIRNYRLSNNCFLLGEKQNPYTYINSSDIYLQSSRYEGYCITLAEARLLNKPIVTTDFAGAKEQIKHLETGFIVKCNSDDIYRGLKALITDNNIRKRFSKNLAKENTYENNQVLILYNLL